MKEEITKQINIKTYRGWEYSTINSLAEKNLKSYIDKHGLLDRILGGDEYTKMSRFFQGVTYLKVPDYVTKVEPYAFGCCTNLTIVCLNGCFEVQNHAFYKCSNLNTITLSNAIAVRTGAFAYAGNMDENKIGLSVYAPKLEIVSPLAFFESAIQFLLLPSVEVLNENAICKCKRLEVLNLPETRRIATNAIRHNDNLEQIFAPKTKDINIDSIKKCGKLNLLVLERIGSREFKKLVDKSSSPLNFAQNFACCSINEYENKCFNESEKFISKTKK